MRIKRTVSGKEYEFELTSDEMFTAFLEQQDLNDIEDIKIAFDYEPNLMPSQEIIKEMASEMRRNMDKYDMEFWYARSDAIDTVLSRHGLEIDYEC